MSCQSDRKVNEEPWKPRHPESFLAPPEPPRSKYTHVSHEFLSFYVLCNSWYTCRSILHECLKALDNFSRAFQRPQNRPDQSSYVEDMAHREKKLTYGSLGTKNEIGREPRKYVCCVAHQKNER
jgi:hypothetical protein